MTVHSLNTTSDSFSGLHDDLYELGKHMASIHFNFCSIACVEDAIEEKALEIQVDHSIREQDGKFTTFTSIFITFDDSAYSDEDDEEPDDDGCCDTGCCAPDDPTPTPISAKAELPNESFSLSGYVDYITDPFLSSSKFALVITG